MSKVVYAFYRKEFSDYNKSKGAEPLCESVDDLAISLIDTEAMTALMEGDTSYEVDPIDVCEGVITDNGKAKFVKKYTYNVPESVKMKSLPYRDYVNMFNF